MTNRAPASSVYRCRKLLVCSLEAVALGLFGAVTSGLLLAQTAVDEETAWPWVRSTNGNTLHLPQVESWASNSFVARAAVGVKSATEKKEILGVLWFEDHRSVDRSNRLIQLDQIQITRGRFPQAKDDGSKALAIVRELFPGRRRTVSLDYLIAALGFTRTFHWR